MIRFGDSPRRQRWLLPALLFFVQSLLAPTLPASGNVTPCPSFGQLSQSGRYTPVTVDLEAKLAPEVRDRLRENISLVFHTKDPAQIDAIEKIFVDQIRETLRNRPAELLASDVESIKKGADQNLDGVEYMFYVDQFGVRGKDANGTFQDATKMLDHLKDLGVETVYALPFLKSPGKDGGFDVSDFRKVSDQLGGNKAFEEFVREARKRGMSVKMDLILNHVSEQHEWFQKLLQGDLKYKDYFITREEPPEIIGRYTDHRGQIVKYRERGPDGQIVEIERRLIFPDIANSHYREIEIPLPNGGKKKLWVYHTFFPFQLDLNYANPAVMKEALGIVSYWANKGVDTFRLDAIPFLDKTAENHPRTHAIVEMMSLFLKHVSPSSNLMVEANQQPVDMIKYLGQPQTVQNGFLDKPVTGTTEASMGYNFGEIPFWASLLEGDKKHILKVYNDLNRLDTPPNTAWATFWRVHDELTLEMVSPDVRKSVNQHLLAPGKEKGLPFRDGFGVSGRMAPFLDNNPERIRMAYSLLLGRPGKPVIYYGDEVAAGNNIEFMVAEGKKRKVFMDRNGIHYETPKGDAKKFFEAHGIPTDAPIDTREGHRGPQNKDDLLAVHDPDNKSVGAKVYRSLKEMIAARRKHSAIRQGKQRILESNRSEVLTYSMESKEESLLMVSNLSDKKLQTSIQIPPPWAGIPETGFLKDAITGTSIPYKREGGRLVIDVGKYDVFWLLPPAAPTPVN